MSDVARHLRAALVLLHVVAVVGLSVPAPPAGLRGGRPDRSTEAALRTWSEVGGAIGVPADRIVLAVRGVTAVQQRAVAGIRGLFRPYAQLVGARQNWLMFGEVPTRVARLEIEVHTPAGWKPVYRGHLEPGWNRTLFDQERIRTLFHSFALGRHRDGYARFVDWAVPRIAADHPDADRVRVQIQKLVIPSPEVLARTGALAPAARVWDTERAVP